MVQLVRKDGKLVRHQGRLATSCDCCEPPLTCASMGKTGVGSDVTDWPVPNTGGLMAFWWTIQFGAAVDIKITAGAASFHHRGATGNEARTFCKPAGVVNVKVEIIDPTNRVAWQYELWCLRIPCPVPARAVPLNPLP